MKKGILFSLCSVVAVLGTITLASAGQITWKILTDASVAGSGPGADLAVGTSDDSTSGENNTCNFSGASDCGSGSVPPVGSYGYFAAEFDSAMTRSCAGGSNAGALCTDIGDCPGGLACVDCPQQDDPPDPWDNYGYLGNSGVSPGNGTFTICQENGSSFVWEALQAGTSGSPDAPGASCVGLVGSGPYTGSPCGVTTGNFTTELDIEQKVGGCLVSVGTVSDIPYVGRVFPTTGTPQGSFPLCGYSQSGVQNIQAAGAAKGGSHIVIMCGGRTVLTDSAFPCLRGGKVYNVLVGYTSADASDCTSPCSPGGGCAASPAE
jgi:hypothetical protein